MIVPTAYWIGVTAYAWVRAFPFSEFQALRELAMIAAFGLPIAYVAEFVWGRLSVLYRLGWPHAATDQF